MNQLTVIAQQIQHLQEQARKVTLLCSFFFFFFFFFFVLLKPEIRNLQYYSCMQPSTAFSRKKKIKIVHHF